MKCQKCEKDFEEKDIQESHDVPCYLFWGIRRIRKQQADKYPRHWLCKKCHKDYEGLVNREMIKTAKEFSLRWLYESGTI